MVAAKFKNPKRTHATNFVYKFVTIPTVRDGSQAPFRVYASRLSI